MFPILASCECSLFVSLERAKDLTPNLQKHSGLRIDCWQSLRSVTKHEFLASKRVTHSSVRKQGRKTLFFFAFFRLAGCHPADKLRQFRICIPLEMPEKKVLPLARNSQIVVVKCLQTPEYAPCFNSRCIPVAAQNLKVMFFLFVLTTKEVSSQLFQY